MSAPTQTPPEQPQTAPKKTPIWRKKWFWIAIGAILVIGTISNIVNPPAKVEVPAVAGTTAEEAKAALTELGFKTSFERADGGLIIATDMLDAEGTDPAAGEELTEGSRVTIMLVEATERIAAAETEQAEADNALALAEAEESEKNTKEAQAAEALLPTPAVAEALWLSMHNVSDPLELLTIEGYDNTLANPLYAIQTGWGGSTSGYLEIKVQEPLTKASTERLCIGIMNFVGPEHPDLEGIIFTDSNGLDNNCFRKQAPLADHKIGS